MNYWEAIVLAIIEGLTEFLPVSSTGHMIIASSFFGIAQEEFTKLFTIAIQLGTILSVVVLYFKRFFQSFDFYTKLLVAFIPAVVLGLLLNDLIDQVNPIGLGERDDYSVATCPPGRRISAKPCIHPSSIISELERPMVRRVGRS